MLLDERQKVARAAITLADSLPDSLLVVLTRRGVLANQVAMMRPRTKGFFAFTPKEVVCRQLSLNRSVQPFRLPFAAGMDETIERATALLLEHNHVRPGGPMIIVSDLLSDHIAANSILLHHA